MIGPFAAVTFLTRLPVPWKPAGSMQDVARSQGWFGAVGLLVGLALVAVDRLAMRALPTSSVDVLVVVTLIAITGALHLDGLADGADGLFGGRTRARRLEIMRDAHAGTYAIVAVVSVLAMKWAGLAALPGNVRVEALLVVPCFARFAMVLAIHVFPYARQDGLGSGFARGAWPGGILLSGATAVLIAAALLGAGGLLVLSFVALVAGGIGLACVRAVGGMTGDTYGATVEICEAAGWLFIAALANRGWIDALAFSSGVT
jgi:adenosylcobinamide-GDP ribazoletransferase